MELATIENHGVFNFKYEEVSPEFLANERVNIVNEQAFVLMRFLPYNLMHVIHDDLIGLYFQLKHFASPNSQLSNDLPFSFNNHLVFVDGHGEGTYGDLYKLFTNHSLLTKHRLQGLTCFRDAVVGNSKVATWYQYGFHGPQGPIPNKRVNGLMVREFAEFIRYRLGLPGFDEDSANDCIVIFTRHGNRKILNLDSLKLRLAMEFALPIRELSIESNSFDEQVRMLSHARVVIGMHGALMTMIMFLRPGSVVIELFPFAVPSENYTPYRTLANLPGMGLSYRPWENKFEENSIAYPDRDPGMGGLTHLSSEDQKKVMNNKRVEPHSCCSDPNWLYRIYQDTKVDLTELIQLVHDAMGDSSRQEIASKTGMCVGSCSESLDSVAFSVSVVLP